MNTPAVVLTNPPSPAGHMSNKDSMGGFAVVPIKKRVPIGRART